MEQRREYSHVVHATFGPMHNTRRYAPGKEQARLPGIWIPRLTLTESTTHQQRMHFPFITGAAKPPSMMAVFSSMSPIAPTSVFVKFEGTLSLPAPTRPGFFRRTITPPFLLRASCVQEKKQRFLLLGISFSVTVIGSGASGVDPYSRCALLLLQVKAQH